MQNRKKGYKLAYLKQNLRVTDVENKFMVTRGYRWGWMHYRTGIDIYTQWYIE